MELKLLITPAGNQYWHYRDMFGNVYHREDGPACIYTNGTLEWFLRNIKYSFEDYCKALNLSGEDILVLKLKYMC